MKKIFTFIAFFLAFHFCSAQYFQATIVKDNNDLIFKIRPNPGGGDISTGWSDIEFFVRWSDSSPTFAFGAITVNNTDFPGVVIPNNGRNIQGTEVGYINNWFGISFSATPANTYTDGMEYEVFRVALNVPASSIPFELVHNSFFFPHYLALVSNSGTDLTNPDDIFFYGPDALICDPNCPATTFGNNHVDSGSIVVDWYADLDGDGFGDPDSSVRAAGQPSGYVANNTDCDDMFDTVFPGAPEICDALDNDCDGVVPADEIDDDGDGFSECEGDCDDALATVYPGAPELCEGIDNDCDGQVDEDIVFSDYYQDGDGDGYGDEFPVVDCQPPGANYVLLDGDCDDTDDTVFPGAPELCGGWDNDCDGVVPAGELDGDGDGFSECEGDCDDLLDTVFPGAPELCDGLDNDCDGVIPADELDGDGDGFSECEGDCDDTLAAVFPGAPELCDGLDNDCDSQVDEDIVFSDYYQDGDGDGYGAGAPANDCQPPGANYVLLDGDCGDTDGTVFPGAPELCDGLDNDCDSEVDEGLSFDADNDGFTAVGSCEGTADDCDDTDATVFPGAPELCDGLDNDCDGVVPADEADGDGDGFSECEGDCDDLLDTVFPGAPELCDGLDNDCDGAVPAGELDGDGDGFSECEGDCDDTLATPSRARRSCATGWTTTATGLSRLMS